MKNLYLFLKEAVSGKGCLWVWLKFFYGAGRVVIVLEIKKVQEIKNCHLKGSKPACRQQ
ncbi:MAG: hypothetical protein LUJ25_10825 [Firmicutes bacterium]|nr:hypothetical protein [Bacillota bacterium]